MDAKSCPIDVFCVLIGTDHLVKRSKKHTKPDQDPHPSDGPQLLPFLTPLCGSTPPGYTCFKQCDLDAACQVLGWDVSKIPCDCPATYCSDGKIYGPPYYNQNISGHPLTDAQLAKQLHVIAPCNGCVQAEIAPYHKQIGSCNKK